MTGDRILLHTLSEAEHIMLGFFREFFAQDTLVFNDDELGQKGSPFPNRFFIDRSQDVDNREFDVVLANDFSNASANALPRVVLEDAGGAQALGLVIDQRRTHSFSPQAERQRVDQIRHTYVVHCLSSTRGESRLLAAIVTYAVTTFRNALLEAGLNKIDPWSTGPTQAIRSDSVADYFDTPVQLTFYTVEQWRTVELGLGTANCFRVSFTPDHKHRAVRTAMTVSLPMTSWAVRTAMTVTDTARLELAVRAEMTVVAAVAEESAVRAAMTVRDATSTARGIRTSMRVS